MKNPPNIYLMVVISVIYLIFAISFSQLFHFSRAFDEGYHLEYITFIKQNGRLPITYEERAQITRADFPPLYHLLVAIASVGTPIKDKPNFKYFRDSFRYQVIDYQTDNVWSLDTEDFKRPYLGRFLVWQIGRWVSIVLSLTTVIIVFFTLNETPLKQYPLASLAGAALLAFIPRYIILGSTLNDDNLLGPLAALCFWMLVKIINKPDRWRPFVALGILLGLSMTVKYTLILVPLELVIVCGAIGYKHNLGWRWILGKLTVVAGLAILCASWWFGWNIWFLNTITEDGWLVGVLRPIMAGGTDTTLNRISGFFSGGQVGLTELPENTNIGSFSQWIQSTFLSFWGVGSPGDIYAYPLVGLMLIVACFGLWRVWQIDAPQRKWLLFLILHIAIFFVLPLIRFGLTRRLSVSAQGRHILIPAATAIVALIIWGLIAVIPQYWQRVGLGAIISGFVMWTGAHVYQFAALADTSLPLRTSPQAAEWLSQPVRAQFGDHIELVSYTLTPQPEEGYIQLDLAWQSLEFANESYLLQIELINSNHKVVSHWIGYNAQGRLPTLAWRPGDVIFDRLTLPLPHVSASDYTLQVQVLSNIGPLTITTPKNNKTDRTIEKQDNILSLSKVSLSKPVPILLDQHLPITDTSEPTEIKFRLWHPDIIQNPSDFTSQKSQNPIYRYPTTISILTAPGNFVVELVDSTGQVWTSTRSEANIHTFIIGPKWLSGQYRVRINKVKDGNKITHIDSPPLLVVENWWDRQFAPPEIEVVTEANFANQFKFLGYKLSPEPVKAGEAFPVTLYWQALPDMSPQVDFTQFNHLHDSQGTLRGGYDRRPLENYSTLLWSPGEVVTDGYAVPVEADAPPGKYYLDVGYYLIVGESAVNLPLVADGEMTEVSSVTIGPIEVVAP